MYIFHFLFISYFTIFLKYFEAQIFSHCISDVFPLYLRYFSNILDVFSLYLRYFTSVYVIFSHYIKNAEGNIIEENVCIPGESRCISDFYLMF